MPAAGLNTFIWNNNLRSLFLLATYPFVLMAMLWGGAALYGAMIGHGGYTPVDPVQFGNAMLERYWPTVVTVVAIWFIVAWFFQNGLIRMASHAQPVTREDEPLLYNTLENLCISRGLQMPSLNVVNSPALNAFASGTTKSTYAITVTRGLLQTLPPDELEAVLGHELTHIINHDCRLMMVAVIFTGMIGLATQMLWSNLRFMLWFPRDRDERRGNGMVLYLALLVVLVIGYLASMLARFAVSRSREFMADAGSVELTKNPDAMMRALMRIDGRDHIPQATDDVAMMCIENSIPFLGLFATHPPIDERIRVISETTRTPIPSLTSTPAQPRPDDDHTLHGVGGDVRNPWA